MEIFWIRPSNKLSFVSSGISHDQSTCFQMIWNWLLWLKASPSSQINRNQIIMCICVLALHPAFPSPLHWILTFKTFIFLFRKIVESIRNVTSKILLIFKPQTTNFKIWNISRTEPPDSRMIKMFYSFTLFNDEVFSIFLLPFSMGFDLSFGKKKVVIFCSSYRIKKKNQYWISFLEEWFQKKFQF